MNVQVQEQTAMRHTTRTGHVVAVVVAAHLGMAGDAHSGDDQQVVCTAPEVAREIERKAAAKAMDLAAFVKAKIASGECAVVDPSAARPQQFLPSAANYVAKEATKSIIGELVAYMFELLKTGATAAWRWAFG